MPRLSQCPSAKRKLAVLLELWRKLTRLRSASQYLIPSNMSVRVLEFLIFVSLINSPSSRIGPPGGYFLSFLNGNSLDWSDRTLLIMLMPYQLSIVRPVWSQPITGSTMDLRRQA